MNENIKTKSEEIQEKYPRLFPNGEPICGFSIGDGWIPLVDKLCQDITNILETVNETITVTQLKEKFGGLRYYIDSCPKELYDQVSNLISKAESDSYQICEVCGEPGLERTNNYWIKTRCDSCQEKHEANRRNGVFNGI